jgi:beta-lactam-binding protein with PASTA domain
MTRQKKQTPLPWYKNTWIMIAINFAAIILLLLLSIWIVNKWMHSFTRHGEEVTVPDITKIRIDKAMELLEENGFRYEITDSVYRDGYKKMDVVEQDPMPGSVVKNGRKIYLVINALDKPSVQVPRLQNKSFSLAKALLKNAGLNLGKVESKKTNLGDGLVLAQMFKGDTIAPYSLVEKGAKIDLIISVKPNPDDILLENGEYQSPDYGDLFD